MKLRIFILVSLLLFQIIGRAQSVSDSLLLTETTLSRPIFLHRNQIRITSGYEMAVINRRFQSDGSIIQLSDINLSGIRHTLPFDLKYGVTDFIQVNLAINHKSQIFREGSDYIVVIDPTSTNPSLTEVYRVTEKRGFDDLLAGVDMRIPFKNNRWDIGLSVGMQTSITGNQTPPPNHELIVTSDSRRFNFKNQGTWSNGVPTLRIGGVLKFRQPKWGITLTSDYRHGLKQGTDRFWTYELVNNNFQYTSNSYSFQMADFLFNQVQFEYQLVSWFNSFFQVNHIEKNNAWVEIRQAQRRLEVDKVTQFYLGFEILATHRLWVRQQFGVSIDGRNSDAPIFFGVTISYNGFIK